MLAALIIILLVGGALAWPAQRLGEAWPRWVSLGVVALDLLVLAAIALSPGGQGPWLAQSEWAWIPRFGISVHLGMDGMSLLLIVLTLFLGVMAVGISWTEIGQRVGFFHCMLLWTLAGVVGVFLSLDLFLFFLFWEVMLVPMYFLIAVWGHEARYRAAIKFFIFTQGSGLLMLAAILALVFAYHEQAHIFSFDYQTLLSARLDIGTAYWIMLGFFIAFAVKLPAVPFHAWLPDAHTQASTGGSVLLAGILLKTGAYGLIRFVLLLFPHASQVFAPVAMFLAVLGIVYGALLAFAQSDLKRLVAYTSISHMGFVLLGVFSGSALALRGAVMQIVAHGIITPGLFMLVGALQERLHTRDMGHMGGLWSRVPGFGAFGMFLAVAALGLPGLVGFVGEFLVLIGTYGTHPVFAVAASLGFVASAIYALHLVQRTFHGETRGTEAVPDLSIRELALFAVIAAAVTALGLYPQPVFDLVSPALANAYQAGGLIMRLTRL
ncbi:MAG TPA: NADH-quinone oxidoreductase subunit M [Gammaproteobacteria bacterium]|nr:NADH-quinone oxidoreductase subunit M [Gammaproteobacteria bacterium]